MKLKLVIDKNCEEEVVVYAHERSKIVEEIESFFAERSSILVGYRDKIAVKLSLSDIYCFVVEDNKVYAITEKDKLWLKCRLYNVESNLNKSFVKINQSCIANIKKIEQFDATISGTLTVIFKNGYKDFVSRRQLKQVKERLGL